MCGLSCLAGVEALNLFVVGMFWFVEVHGLHGFPEHVFFSVAAVESDGLLVCSAGLISTPRRLGDPRASGELGGGVPDVARHAWSRLLCVFR